MRHAVLGTVRSTQPWLVWVASVLLVLPFFCISVGAQEEEKAPGALKSGAEFKKQLAAKLSIKWSGVSLRAGLERLGKASDVAILLDRRIDPEQTIELNCQDLPLEQIVQMIALHADASMQTLASVLYIGPTETAASLPLAHSRLRQHLDRLPATAKRYWLTSQPKPSWPEGCEPQLLVKEWFAQSQVTLNNPTMIPHDLWPAIALPSLSRQDQLSLLLAGFDLTCEIKNDGTQAQLAPLPTQKIYSQRLPLIAGISPDITLTQIRTAFPTGKVRRDGTQLIFDGTAEDHTRVRKLLLGNAPQVIDGSVTPPAPADKRFTLTAERQAAGVILKAIAKEQGLTLVYPPQMLNKLKEHVSIRVKNVTLAELLEDTLKPLGLKATVDEKTITIGTL